MSGPYDDIINLPHHVSAQRPHMPMADRAAQFSPFAALSGYGDAVREAARLTGGKAELAEEEKAALDARLRKLRPGSSAAFTVFRPDERKEGGAYVTAEGVVRRIDGCAREIVLADGRRLGIEDILEVRLLAPEGET
ncbi:hypothetical protein [uncultured Oscillibacter sp.]|uniref:hypothetical protein n=1 Tax=uncultured Oscillibacter sp. TaxID=876091 RepID=UPI002604D0BC|nr:hypothetical protein [uncultured Oscillibacter sp.]